MPPPSPLHPFSPTTTARERTLQLLELQELITAHLNISDLLQCVQVSRGWYQAFAGVLWGSCDDQTRPWHRILQCAVPPHHQPDKSLTEDRRQDALLVFEKLAPFIQELSSQRYYTIHLFLELHRKNEKSSRRPQLRSIYLNLEGLWGDFYYPTTFRFSPSNDEDNNRNDRFKDVPAEALFGRERGGNYRAFEMKMRNQIRACWQLILYHRSSLRTVDFTSGAFLAGRLIPANLTFILATPMHTEKREGIEMEMERETSSSLFLRSLSQASEGAQFLAKTLQAMPRLRHLRLDVPQDYGWHALPIITQCGLGALQSLDFQQASFSNMLNSYQLSKQSDPDGSYRSLFVDPRIRRLRVGRVSPTLMARLVQDIFPSLEYLQADMVLEEVKNPGDEVDNNPLITLSENWRLKTLRIETGGSPQALMAIPIQWMALVTLEYPIMTLFELPALLERMPKIKSVSHVSSYKNPLRNEVPVPFELDVAWLQSQQKPWHLSLEQFSTSGVMAAPNGQSGLLLLLPQMVNVTRLHLGKIGRDVVRCMANSSLPLLEEFVLDIRQPCSVDVTTLVTTTCPRLRILRGGGLAMRAMTVCQKPWICTNLREFQCLIVGVPTLSKKQETDLAEGPPELPNNKIENMDAWTPRHLKYTEVVKLKEKSKLVQRQTFAEFARLRQLRTLDLGDSLCHSDHKIRSGNSLNVSLENGLDQLRTLQNLRVFGMNNLDHQMKEKEAEWMVEHWPNFAMLKGCVSKHWITTAKETRSERRTVSEMDVINSLQPLARRLKQLKPSVVFCDNEYSEDD